MSLTDSPELEYYEEGKPPEKEPSFLRKYWLRIVLALGLVAVAIVALIGIIAQIEISKGTGSITGQVVDPSGLPLPGVEVFVSGSNEWALTDTEGRFTLEAAPVGEQTLVVVQTSVAESYSVAVPLGGTLDVGQIIFSPDS